jgi:intracellular multiplication protein IcmE
MDTQNPAPNGPEDKTPLEDRQQILQGNSGPDTAAPAPTPKKRSYGDAVKSFYSDPATRKMALVTTGVAIAALGFGGYRVLAGPSAPHAKIQDQVEAPALKGVPGGDKGSKAFNQQLNQANAQMGAQAAKAGQTYVPTPTALHPLHPAKPKTPPIKKKAPPPKTPVVANPYTPQQVAAANKQESALEKAMETELQRFDTNTPYAPVQVVSISKPPKSTATTNSAGSEGGMQGATTTKQVLANPGYLDYAMLDSSVNSNVPGPILATVESGRFKGARLLGAFKREHFRDVLQFSQMTWNHQDYHINAYAISPKNAQLGMATSVNDHVLYRYAMLFAGSFLQGLDEALTDSNENVTAGDGYAIVTHELNNGQILEQAVGNVGNTISPIAEQQFNIPPTVRVAAGTGMGILFMDVVKGKGE